jgi:uncharacterized membrane protein YqiK
MRERARSIKDAARVKTREAQLDRASAERAELRAENEVLRDRIRDAQAERGQWFSIMERLADSMPDVAKASAQRPSRHRLRRLLVVGAAAGSAYVFGAKAGRGRYEQIRAWWHRVRTDEPGVEETGVTTATA